MTTSPDPDTPPEIDFTSNAWRHRLKQGGGYRQALARAVGLKSGQNAQIVDATAGMGRDAFVMAALGATVTMIERSEIMAEKLDAALTKALGADPEVADIAKRINLLHGDARNLLPDLHPHTVYIDPMHPPRKSSALVKKEMRQIRALVGDDADSTELLAVALDCTAKRVVLKQPRKADPIATVRPPSHQIVGKTTRYDVWMIS